MECIILTMIRYSILFTEAVLKRETLYSQNKERTSRIVNALYKNRGSDRKMCAGVIAARVNNVNISARIDTEANCGQLYIQETPLTVKEFTSPGTFSQLIRWFCGVLRLYSRRNCYTSPLKKNGQMISIHYQ